MVDYNSVFILQKVLPSTISCSGFNQGLEISCAAHTGADLLLLSTPPPPRPLPTQTAITAGSDGH